MTSSSMLSRSSSLSSFRWHRFLEFSSPRECFRFRNGAPARRVSFLLRRFGVALRILRPLGPPLLRLVRFVDRGVPLNQPVEGFGDAQLSATLFRDGLLAGLQPLVALDEQRLGLGVLLLTQQRSAEH